MEINKESHDILGYETRTKTRLRKARELIFSGSRAGRNGEGNGSAQGGLGVYVLTRFL